jgi:hypothetical protein
VKALAGIAASCPSKKRKMVTVNVNGNSRTKSRGTLAPVAVAVVVTRFSLEFAPAHQSNGSE